MSMRYQETVELSAELLRLAIPLMSQQAAALNPVSYAVWYEYVAGINKPLREAIDRLLQGNDRLDDAATEDLYRTHIVERDQQAAHRVTSGFRRVMANVSEETAHAGLRAHQFGSLLEQWTGELGDPERAAARDETLDELLAGTREMQKAMAALQDRLDASRQEIETLRREVIRARGEALADELTGLLNRRGFDVALSTRLSAPETMGSETCLLFADLDHFKRVNDSYGHLTGDKVLRAVGQVLKANIKGKDTAARYGGEEFAVLLPETGISGAQHLAETVRATIARSRIRRVDDQQAMAQITVSFGVGRYRPGESVEQFVSRVDSALYVAKAHGRNCVRVSPEPAR